MTVCFHCRSITGFAEEYKKRGLPLHVLVENAGVFLVPFDRTQEGFETTVGTNYFGELHFAVCQGQDLLAVYRIQALSLDHHCRCTGGTSPSVDMPYPNAGHFLLSHLLLDSLEKTAQKDGEARSFFSEAYGAHLCVALISLRISISTRDSNEAEKPSFTPSCWSQLYWISMRRFNAHDKGLTF